MEDRRKEQERDREREGSRRREMVKRVSKEG
jgi:hypothetical protein